MHSRDYRPSHEEYSVLSALDKVMLRDKQIKLRRRLSMPALEAVGLIAWIWGRALPVGAQALAGLATTVACEDVVVSRCFSKLLAILSVL